MLKERDCFYDNLKGILILLVVFGHVISPVKNTSTLLFDYLFKFIYIFHMPIFIFVSGKLTFKNSKLDKFLFKVTIPLFVFQIIYTLEEIYINKVQFNIVTFFLEPFSILWYLTSLIYWRIMIAKTVLGQKSILIFLGALVISIVVGNFKQINLLFSLSRTIVYFPFFYLGYYLNDISSDELIKSFKVRQYLSILILLLTFIIFVKLDYFNYPKKMFWGALSFSALNIDSLNGFLFRGLVIIMALSITIILVSLVNSKQSVLTSIGKKSLQIYLFHFLIIRILFAQGFYNLNFDRGVEIFILLFISYSITWLCQHGIFSMLVNWMEKLSDIVLLKWNGYFIDKT